MKTTFKRVCTTERLFSKHVFIKISQLYLQNYDEKMKKKL